MTLELKLLTRESGEQAHSNPMSFSIIHQLLLQEIPQYILAHLCHKGLRVELDTLNRVLSVAQAHNLTVLRPGGYLQAFRKVVTLHHQRVVADGGEGVGQPGKHSLASMMYQGRLAMHYLLRQNDSATVAITDTLVTQADPE